MRIMFWFASLFMWSIFCHLGYGVDKAIVPNSAKVFTSVPTPYLEKGMQEVEKKSELYAPSLMSGLFRLVLSLAIVVACIYGVFYVLRRNAKRNNFQKGTQNIKILSKYSLEQKKAIYILDIAGQLFVVGSGERELVLITEIKNKESVELIKNQEESVNPVSFRKLLGSFSGTAYKTAKGGENQRILEQSNLILKDKIKNIKNLTVNIKSDEESL